jgi:outer membrane lipoprotein-sorting protein/peroxiredoxin
MKIFTSVCIALVVWGVRASGQDDGAAAQKLLDDVAAGFKDAQTLAFTSEIRTKIETVEVVQKAEALLGRPNVARVALTGLGQDALIVLDGKTSWHWLKSAKKVASSPQAGTMKLEQYGVGPLATLFFERGTGPLRAYLADASVTKEALDDVECRVVAWKVGSEETRLWVAGNTLRRFRTTRLVDGKRFEQTFHYGVVDLAPTVALDAFVFVVPSGAVAIAAGDESKLLAVGVHAPDFAATTVDGRETKPADFKGGPVLLTFWFHACATCREELPRIEALHVEYARRGVKTWAVNFGDGADVVAAYFAKERFTVTPLLQRKSDVSRAFGVRSYPTTYVLDAEGKVVWRAVGFDATALRVALDRVAPPPK